MKFVGGCMQGFDVPPRFSQNRTQKIIVGGSAESTYTYMEVHFKMDDVPIYTPGFVQGKNKVFPCWVAPNLPEPVFKRLFLEAHRL